MAKLLIFSNNQIFLYACQAECSVNRNEPVMEVFCLYTICRLTAGIPDGDIPVCILHYILLPEWLISEAALFSPYQYLYAP